MILFANFLVGIAQVLSAVLGFLLIMIIARVVVSWVDANPGNPLVRFIVDTTDPIFRPLQRKINLQVGMIDLSPIIVLLLIIFLQSFLVGSLMDYGQSLRFSGQL